MLKIKTNNEEDLTFIFLTPSPHQDRDTFKEKLSDLINALRSISQTQSADTVASLDTGAGFRPPTLSMTEIKARQTLLQRDFQLAKLHKDLVRSGQLSEEEFWETRSVWTWK
jgi:hypothetical protein